MSRRRVVSALDETQPRLKAIVENSAPDPDRPKLSDEFEKQLEPVERKTAACYASMEDATARLRRITTQINSRRAVPNQSLPIEDSRRKS